MKQMFAYPLMNLLDPLMHLNFEVELAIDA